MNNTKELYYKLEYIMPKKDGVGAIKIKIDFNKHFMKYFEFDMSTGEIMKHIYIQGYDYDLAVDVLLEADVYRAKWSYVEFF